MREYFWQYSIVNNGLKYYALGIYGKIDPEYSVYTQDAIDAAKVGRGHPDFWLKYLVSSIYFSGIHQQIDYIAPYPGHKEGSSPTVMEEPIIFAKCFRKAYLKDLIIRHTTAKKSAYARAKKESLDCLNQLNTIKLNKHPSKDNREETYKNTPLKKNKTVLVVDDFCTQGYSLEAARIYIQQTGANTISLSLLKTIYRDYEQIIQIDKFNPFEPNNFSSIRSIKHSYKNYISQPYGYEEISTKLTAYDNWQWPNGI